VSRIVVTGGAGFVGSHLCEAILHRGDEVVCVDDLSSGCTENLQMAARHSGFEFVRADVSEGLELAGRVDAVAHLASPASPPEYLRRPLETLAVGSRGTETALRLASRHGARFVLASTSEVYGDPLVHPQTEDYWGHVNPIGPRSCYDEGKRYSETLFFDYWRQGRLQIMWRASSTPMARACIPTMGAWYRISSCRHCSAATSGGRVRGTDGVEGIIAVGAREHAEGKQQRQGAEARHQQIDETRP